jgi:homoprotocatechuate degradation regulator HpaR
VPSKKKAPAPSGPEIPDATGLRHRELLPMLLRTRELLLAQFKPVFQAAGLTAQQLRILTALHVQGDLEPRQLCEECVILGPSIVAILNGLEQQALISRHKVPDDNRRVHVRLEPKGQAVIDETLPQLDAIYAHMGASVSPQRLHDACVMLESIVNDLPPVAGATSRRTAKRRPT